MPILGQSAREIRKLDAGPGRRTAGGRLALAAGFALLTCIAPSPLLAAGDGSRGAKPVAGKPTADAPTLTPQQAVERANAYFNGVTTMAADFLQLSADGQRLQGKLYVQKPGRLRFEYDPPAPIEVVADGTSVAVLDNKLYKQDLYFIGQTPLKFLLQEQIDLGRDTKVLDVSSNSKTTSVTIEDSATFGGTSRITLVFDTANFQLQQWIVTDPQGYETTVSLFNVDLGQKPDPALFKIDYQRPSAGSRR